MNRVRLAVGIAIGAKTDKPVTTTAFGYARDHQNWDMDACMGR